MRAIRCIYRKTYTQFYPYVPDDGRTNHPYSMVSYRRWTRSRLLGFAMRWVGFVGMVSGVALLCGLIVGWVLK